MNNDMLIEPEIREFRIEECVRLEEICVPLSECVCVVPGPISDDVLQALSQGSFDQAPVCDDRASICYGLISRLRLEQLHRMGLPLEQNDSAISNAEFRVGIHTTAYDIIDRLAASPAAIVIQESDAIEYGHAEWLVGLLTISDLNKHAIRGTLYRLISEAEAAIAALMRHTFDDPWDWIKLLNEDYQVRVLGFWELARRRDVDIGPVAAVTLSNLLTIIGKSSDLRSRLGYSSRKRFEKSTGKIPDFRNRIMHPVRPLILNRKDVEQLREVTLVLENLRDRSQKELTAGGHNKSFHWIAEKAGSQ
jgi:hypothetical protein